MTADPEATGKTAITDELLEQLGDQATVLSALDEAEDVALDLHERPFSSETRQRALKWLQSDRYDAALQQMRALRGSSTTGTD